MKGEAVTNDAMLSEPAKDARPILRLSETMRRYWSEAVVVALALLLWVPRLSGPIDLRWDAGVYYVLGTSLATGQGYRILSEPGAPEALQYPPLLPAIVALHQRVLGSINPAVVGPWLRLSFAALFLCYGLAALALARRYLRAGFAVIAVALSLLQVNTLFVSDLLFTEVPFALVSVLFVLVAVDGRFASRPWLREALSFLLVSAGFLLRTAGVALLAAWVLESLVRRQWRLTVIRVLLSIIPVLMWQAHVTRVRGSYEYAHPAYEYQRAPYQFYNVSYAENVGPTGSAHAGSLYARGGALALRMAKNTCLLGKRLGEAVSNSEGYWRQLLWRAEESSLGHRIIPPRLLLVPIIALSLLVIGGMGVLLYRRAWLIPLIVGISLALICTTPWPDQFQRYLVPVMPFLAIGVVLAIYQAFFALRRSTKRAAVIGQLSLGGVLLLALIVQIQAVVDLFSVRKREGATFLPGRGFVGPHLFFGDPLWRGWEQAVAWINEHSPPDAIAATPYCHLFYLRTGRHAVTPPVEPDPARTRQLLEGVPVSYVIVDRGYSLPAVEHDAPSWYLTHSFDGTKLYEHRVTPHQNAIPKQ
jgi:hypothetical protein